MVVPLSLSLAAGGDGNILDLMETEVRATDRCDACEDEEELVLGVGDSDNTDSMQGISSSKSGDLLFPISQDSDAE